ncbi:MAG: hypothetical protein AAGA96_19165 [Verrucomicrobiota bacterium]
MKKCFAIFCATILMPMFSAQAWVGGPFSFNTYGDVQSEDGVYEASAAGETGAIGVFRFIVGNTFQGVNAAGVVSTTGSQQATTGNVVINVPSINSGNIFIGGIGGRSNIWFFQGVGYYGTTLGSIVPGSGSVTGFGFANDGNGNGTNTIESFFTATLDRRTRYVAATVFRGQGSARVTNNGTTDFNFSVFGAKVSNNIFIGL